jgi:hypothetical protein
MSGAAGALVAVNGDPSWPGGRRSLLARPTDRSVADRCRLVFDSGCEVFLPQSDRHCHCQRDTDGAGERDEGNHERAEGGEAFPVQLAFHGERRRAGPGDRRSREPGPSRRDPLCHLTIGGPLLRGSLRVSYVIR